MKIGRLLATIITMLAIVAMVAGCGASPAASNSPAVSGTPAPSAAGATASSAQATTSADNSPKGDPITFTAFFGSAQPSTFSKDNTVFKYMTEQTGVSLNIEWLVADLNTKIGVLIASGDYPDFIWGYDQHQKFIDAGAAIPLNDYIDKFGDNVKKAYTPEELQRNAQADGKIYILNPNRSTVNVSYAIGGIYVQRRVLADAGYPKITTLDQCFNMLNAYVAKNPTTDGNKTIAFGGVADSDSFWDLLMPISLLSGHPDDGQVCYIDPSNDQAVTYGRSDDAKYYWQQLNKEYLLGNLDPEFFTNNTEQYNAKRSTGSVLACFDFWWHIGDVQSSLKQQGKQDYVYVALPAMLHDGEVFKDQMGLPESVRDGVSISTSCKNPERAFKLLNWILGEDVQKLQWWGTKGTDYTVDSNGLFSRTPEMRKNMANPDYQTKVGYQALNYPWPEYHNDATFADGNTVDPEYAPGEVSALYDEFDKKVLDAYGVNEYSAMFPTGKPNPWGVAWDITFTDGSDQKIADTAIKDLEMTWVPKLVMAPAGTYDAVWSKYLAEFDKINYQSIETLITKTINDRMAAAK